MDELRVLLTNSFLDILAINESKIDDSIPDNDINQYSWILGYNMVRNDRNRSGGGVVLYIRETTVYLSLKGGI